MEREQVVDMERSCSAERHLSSKYSEVRRVSIQKRTCLGTGQGPGSTGKCVSGIEVCTYTSNDISIFTHMDKISVKIITLT